MVQYAASPARAMSCLPDGSAYDELKVVSVHVLRIEQKTTRQVLNNVCDCRPQHSSFTFWIFKVNCLCVPSFLCFA